MVDPKATWIRRQAAARKYQPTRIRLLLVAESPPDGDHYFYFEQADKADFLFEEKPNRDKMPFLKELKRRGVFLVDLKPDGPRLGEALAPYVGPFLLNLDALAPEKIILIKADVYDALFPAMKKRGLPVVDVRIPFPAFGQQVNFRREFRQALVRGGQEKLIRALKRT